MTEDKDDPLLRAPVLAKILGITQQRLRQLCKEGMPRAGRGQYPLVKCVRWYLRYWKERTPPKKRDRLKQRYLFIRAEMADLKLQEATGKLAHKLLLEIRQSDIHQMDRMLQGLASKIGDRLGCSLEATDRIRRLIEAERDNFVREYTDFDDDVVRLDVTACSRLPTEDCLRLVRSYVRFVEQREKRSKSRTLSYYNIF